MAAREILLNTPAVANLIRENKIAQIKTTLQTSAREGMITMDNALLTLYQNGAINKEIFEENVSTPSKTKSFKLEV